MHVTSLESPSLSTLTSDPVTGQHGVTDNPLIRKVLAAAILSSFLAGLAVGLMTHSGISHQGNYASSIKQVTMQLDLLNY